MNSKRDIMRSAWRIARKGAARFGGNPREYMGDALRSSWAESREAFDAFDFAAEKAGSGAPDAVAVFDAVAAVIIAEKKAEKSAIPVDTGPAIPYIQYRKSNGVGNMTKFALIFAAVGAVALFAVPAISAASAIIADVAQALATIPGLTG